MKNACRLIVCVIVLLVAASSYADEICSVSTVALTGPPDNRVVRILNVLQVNRGIGAPPDVSCYEIQFVSGEQLTVSDETKNLVSAMRPFDGSFTYQPDAADSRPIYISGLNLKQGDDLVLPTDPALGREKSFLNIIGTTGRRVILKDSILANVRHGIFADGDGPIDIDNVTITGDAAKSGPCLSVEASGTTVRSSNFSSCSEGIRIAASNTLLGPTDAARYAQEKNIIHDNAIGIHQISGSGNRWPYNSIYANGRSVDDGISVVGGSRPVVRLNEGEAAELQCSRGETDSQTSTCKLQFTSLPAADGEIELYKTSDNLLDMFQGKDYIARCAVMTEDACVFDTSNASAVLSNIDCGESGKCRFVAIFTGESSSMYSVAAFTLEKRTSTIPVIAMPIPGDNPPGVSEGNTGGDEIARNDPQVAPPDGNPSSVPDDGDDDSELASAMDGGGFGIGAASAEKSCSLTATSSRMAWGDLPLLILLLGMIGLRTLVKRRVLGKS